MTNPYDPLHREKENMSEPQEEFIADSPHELPPAARGRNGEPISEKEAHEADAPTPEKRPA